jgi:hypothetical protein
MSLNLNLPIITTLTFDFLSKSSTIPKEEMREEEELVNIDQALKIIYEYEDEGYTSLESKDPLLQLEKKKRQHLEAREASGDSRAKLYGWKVG